MAGALRGMGAVAAGLIIASGIKLMPALARHPLGRPACLLLAALCFIAVALLRLPLKRLLDVRVDVTRPSPLKVTAVPSRNGAPAATRGAHGN